MPATWRAHWAIPQGQELAAAGTNFLAIDPRDPETVVAGGQQGILKSSDGGGSWTTILPTRTGRVLFDPFDPFDPEILYALTSEGLQRSTDGGAHWAAVGLALSRSFATLPAQCSTCYNFFHGATSELARGQSTLDSLREGG